MGMVGLLNQVYLTNNLMNGGDWLNGFCMLSVMEWFLVWQPVYSMSLTFKCWGTTTAGLRHIC